MLPFLAAPLFGRQLSPLYFMTTMLAIVLAWSPLLIYNPGFQLSVAAVFGILLLRRPLQAFVSRTILRPVEKPPELLSKLLAVSLAAQITTAPIIVSSFGEASVIGAVTNLIAVPLSAPILTLGLLGVLAGNITAPLAYLANASNGFLVTILAWVAETASAPLRCRRDAGSDAAPDRSLLPGLRTGRRRRGYAPRGALAESGGWARDLGDALGRTRRRTLELE